MTVNNKCPVCDGKGTYVPKKITHDTCDYLPGTALDPCGRVTCRNCEGTGNVYYVAPDDMDVYYYKERSEEYYLHVAAGIHKGFLKDIPLPVSIDSIGTILCKLDPEYWTVLEYPTHFRIKTVIGEHIISIAKRKGIEESVLKDFDDNWIIQLCDNDTKTIR
jgi:hypothetical protein